MSAYLDQTVLELKTTAQHYCKRHRIDINQHRLKRIVLKVVKRMEREADRLTRIEIITPDGYRCIDYSDPTGESAVRNIMREAIAG
ncbi:hypothetical protein [Corynebacterium heidelbergense]|uniref:Uncharacterized protein n=1 Tax=Corynebacterium heidelbergense TaxID=2055947 RepID=A0A364VE22_9CORY|nr:hypothetical protein [Corynebacterium heidelbergense]RAV34878.1 hypothetical protein CWC39_00635 [Corynebacterium heidelbergense]WCZ36013.1 hypothetical protein CHEID_02230 [Corynebacterium heidelbergense]